MDKKRMHQIAFVFVGAIIGAGATYVIMKNAPSQGCRCEKKRATMESIRKQKEESVAHRDSKKYVTSSCDSCPHKV